MNLAYAYNQIAERLNDGIPLSNKDLKEDMDNLKSAIGGLLCIYDPNDENDCNDLSDKVMLWEVTDGQK